MVFRLIDKYKPMNSAQIEKNLKKLTKNLSNKEFIFDLLRAYGTPKATVTLLKKGKHNLSKKEGQIILKKKLFFQEVQNEDLHATIDSLQKNEATMKHNPRFIIVTDYKSILASDTKTGEQLDAKFENLAKHYDFFLPWSGIEKHKHINENPADRKAAEKMAKLYDEILDENSISGERRTHDLNIFLSRLLFCFFAEDTNIFNNGLFTDSIASHTLPDGSDLDNYLEKLFNVLNTKNTSSYPAHFQKFPYVNGGLFKNKHWIPKFSAKSRKIIIECGELNWAEINPDIFGSMIQAVVHPSERGSLGMHYTSVPNIMKVIEPLFLDELYEEFEKNKGNNDKLLKLFVRLSKIKIFDPACGSGNFLIISYKELRRLEVAIIKSMGTFCFSDITLDQFYGIEIDDFAHEIAKLSLYLAEHQMNIEFKKEFGETKPTLPLKESGNIVCDNATTIDWRKVCSQNSSDEIYLLGNPPYVGSSMQSNQQKKELANLCKGFKNYKNLDYISCWFINGAKYINNISAKMAFVSTNSICQGEQVALLWPHILKDDIEIGFTHTSFKWSNNAKHNAGVTVVIIGIRNKSKENKYIFSDGQARLVKNINAYLTTGRNVFIPRRSKPISRIPTMVYGIKPTDGGNLILSKKEQQEFLKEDGNTAKYIKKFMGAEDFLKGHERYCLWIQDKDLAQAKKISKIKERLDKIKKFRLKSKAKCTAEFAETPHKFKQITYKNSESIFVPSVSSERRKYIPFGFLGKDTVISNAANAIYDAEPWIFGIISSLIHMVWVRAVCGSLETRIRYSSALGYNTFPIPPLTTKQKEEITRHVYNVLEEREKHPEKNMAQSYDPDKMPEGLKEAHYQLDLAVERIYRSKPFSNDEERLEFLFNLYEKMIEDEKEKNLTLNFN